MKLYYIQYNVGRAKYLISFHDGQKQHNDGSDFYDIRIFKNKPSLNSFVKGLINTGYKER